MVITLPAHKELFAATCGTMVDNSFNDVLFCTLYNDGCRWCDRYTMVLL